MESIQNDVWELSLVDWAWSRPAVSGWPPTPRFGHTAIPLGDCMVVFGGMTNGSNACRDVYILETSGWTWRAVAVQGDVPPELTGHSSALVRLIYIV